jgi:glycosyltransferase involved in cell wall biosynthesis
MNAVSKPLVTVVIPTYNRASVIGTTVTNVLRQTYENFELVVVDDGSTDNTQEVLAQFGEKIRIVRQENGGAAKARNRGATEARGEILAFQDSDDEWHPTKLARQVDLLQRVGPSVPCCVCNAIFRPRNANDSEKRTFTIAKLDANCEQGRWLNPAEVLATRPLFFNQVVAVRREAFLAVGGFRSGLKYLEDWDLALRLAMLGAWAFIREPLTYWNPDSVGSFTARAETETMQLHECARKVISNAIPIAVAESNPQVVSYLKRTLRGHDRLLFALRLRDCAFPGAGLMTRAILFAEDCKAAFFRRAGMLPKMITESAD